MKLKLIGLVVCILGSSSVWARRMPVLSCQQPGKGFSGFSLAKGVGAVGYLNYNYSSASLTCPYNSVTVMEEKGSITCYGSWDSDRGTRPSIAWVEITNDGKNITAKSQTNRAYGSVLLSFNCEVKEEEVWQ